MPAAPARRATDEPRSGVISERALRIVALGRKSSLFVAPGACGTSVAALLSVLRTCELIRVNPYDYLVDALPRLALLINRKDTAEDAAADFDRLTPAAWSNERIAQSAGHRASDAAG